MAGFQASQHVVPLFRGLYGIRADERVVLGSYFPFSVTVTGRVVSAAASTCSEQEVTNNGYNGFYQLHDSLF